MNKNIGIVLVIIILLVSLNIYISSKFYTNFLEGLWVGSENFCKDSGIDGFLIYLGPAALNYFRIKRKAYLIMYANDSVLVNKPFDIEYFPISGLLTNNPEILINLIDPEKTELEEIDDPSMISLEKIMPLKQIIKLDINQGKMIWENENTVYLECYKDNQSFQIDRE